MTDQHAKMRLLVITQELATDSSNMSVGHLWAQHLAPLVNHLDVIATTVGNTDLPDNVAIHRLGKECGRRRPARWSTLLARCHELIGSRSVDGVLAHMVPAYALAASPWCVPLRIPLVLWYTSHGLTGTLRAAVRVVTAAVTASPESFPLVSDRTFVVGHGIDTLAFAAELRGIGSSAIPAVGVAGRMTPLKGILTVIEAVAQMRDDGAPVNLQIAGAPFYPSDHAYLDEVHRRVRELDLADHVTFRGALSGTEMPAFYAGLDVFIAWRTQPALDKSGLEALATGTLLVTNNPSYRDLLGEFATDLLVPSSPQDLAQGLQTALALHTGLRDAVVKTLRQRVIEHHAADRLAERLIQVFTALRQHRHPPFPRASSV